MTGSETYLDANGEIAPIPVLDHEQTGIAPGYRIAEVTDGWVAVAATTDAQRAALDGLGGVDALVKGTVADALAALADAGVPSEQVRLDQGEPFFSSADNDAAGLIARYDHVDYGQRRTAGRVLDLRRPRREARPRAARHSASTPSRCSPKSASTPPPSTRSLASGAALAWKATSPA